MTPAAMMCVLVNATLPMNERVVPETDLELFNTLRRSYPSLKEVQFRGLDEIPLAELRSLFDAEWAKARRDRYAFYMLKAKDYRAIDAWLTVREASV